MLTVSNFVLLQFSVIYYFRMLQLFVVKVCSPGYSFPRFDWLYGPSTRLHCTVHLFICACNDDLTCPSPDSAQRRWSLLQGDTLSPASSNIIIAPVTINQPSM